MPDACHIKQASKSSLPVPIFIGRWTDQINLQAEVTESGIKLFSYMAGHEYRSRYQRIISSLSNRLADATSSKSGVAYTHKLPTYSVNTRDSLKHLEGFSVLRMRNVNSFHNAKTYLEFDSERYLVRI